jgi:dienelactone hydrolase
MYPSPLRPGSALRHILPPATVLAVVLVWALAGLSWSAETSAPAGEEVLFAPAGAKAGEQVRGYLQKPEGQGPFPAVILLHGCSGLGNGFPTWEKFFLDMGLATLAVDSFGPRGAREICSDFSRVTTQTRTGDAYGALAFLAGRPDMQPDRIMLLGFSHGGGVTLDAVSSVGRSHYPDLPKDAPTFRAAAAFYPPCGEKSRMQARYQTPVLLLLGANDDICPAADCQKLADRHQDGPPLLVSVFPGALHGFASPDLPRTYRPNIVNANSPTGKGATVGGDAGATAKAKAQIEPFVRRFVLAP